MKPDLRIVFVVVSLACGCSSGGGGGNGGAAVTVSPPPTPPTPAPPTGSQPARCENGSAGEYACSGVALRSRVSLAATGGSRGNDIWGWVDPQTAREYALMGMSDATAFVDITDPENPRALGTVPTQSGQSLWRDIKVYLNHAYVVADNAGAHGMQVFDLKRLRDAVPPETFMPDTVYVDFENAHNLAINEDTGFAYAVSTNTCGGGLHIIDIRTPNNPLFAGCHSSVSTHDTQCVVCQGPDAQHRGREICVSSNANHLEVVDVTDKSAPATLSSTVYDQLGYVHQGWLTEDHRFFLLGDELDETRSSAPTRTLVFDTYPEGDAAGFDGAWSVYPYLPSGVIIVHDQTNGLFVLSIE